MSRDLKHFRLTLLTNDPSVAAAADRAGVDRIGIDLEIHGKHSRQSQRSSWISHHQLEDLEAIGAELKQADLFCRTNPWNHGGAEELERVLALGARVVMLPMFRNADEPLAFLDRVRGRAWPVLLVETVEAVRDLPRLLQAGPGFEIHIGLNDLGISRGHACPYTMLTDPLLREACAAVTASGIPLSVGRLARPDDTALPLNPDLLCALNIFLGASGAFLSGLFLDRGRSQDPEWLRMEISKLRNRLEEWQQANPTQLETALATLSDTVDALCARSDKS